jgi:hypothetical protein
MNAKTQNAIDLLIDNFDFQKVHTHMALVGWTYFDENGTPTIRRLKERAKEGLKKVSKAGERVSEWSCGGFEAKSYSDDRGNRIIRLEFVIEEKEEYI